MEREIKKLAKFIGKAIKDAKKDPHPVGCHRFVLDSELAVYIGWLDGYDKDSYAIHASDNPSYCLNVVIGLINDTYWAELDAVCVPCDTIGPAFESMTLVPNENVVEMAAHLYHEYMAYKYGESDNEALEYEQGSLQPVIA